MTIDKQFHGDLEAI